MGGFLPCFDEVLLWEVGVVYVAVVVCPGTGQALGHPAAEVGEAVIGVSYLFVVSGGFVLPVSGYLYFTILNAVKQGGREHRAFLFGVLYLF